MFNSNFNFSISNLLLRFVIMILQCKIKCASNSNAAMIEISITEFLPVKQAHSKTVLSDNNIYLFYY